MKRTVFVLNMEFLNFHIQASGPVSAKFLQNHLLTFEEGASYIRSLPYGRNKNKAELTTVFDEGCATCSTKHALLKLLADENNIAGLRLTTGLFRMNAANTPKIASTLQQYRLDYIPEAHNYLKWENLVLDCTHRSSAYVDFEQDLIEEMEILPDQITDFKVAYHRQYLKDWLAVHPSIHYTLDELWTIREQCIADLSVSK